MAISTGVLFDQFPVFNVRSAFDAVLHAALKFNNNLDPFSVYQLLNMILRGGEAK